MTAEVAAYGTNGGRHLGEPTPNQAAANGFDWCIMTAIIHSKRLDLIPLTPAFLRAMLEHDLAGAGGILQARIPDDLLDSTDAIALRLKQLEADPTFQPWSLRAMVLREGRVMIGHIGFHTSPGDEYLRPYAPGGVEFGFTVYPPFLRQGYAREASVALMHWAHQVHDVSRFVLSIRPDNMASQALAAGLGFVRIGSHLDDVDGLEDILLHADATGADAAAGELE